VTADQEAIDMSSVAKTILTIKNINKITKINNNIIIIKLENNKNKNKIKNEH
jgi:hypothetical protein